jgi:predicted DNA-binding transcriptional regulator AlpA
MNIKDKKPEGRTARIRERLISSTVPRGLTDIITCNEPTPASDLNGPINRRSGAREPPKLSRIIRKDKLPEYVGVERSAIETMIDADEFPAPIKVNNSGRILGWLER